MARVVYPPSPHIVQNSRELSVKSASAPPFIGGLPLTGGPGCSISQRRDGGISSRAAPFPMIGKGRGIGLNKNGGLLMNFTNSPYERMMKEPPIQKYPSRRRYRKERLVRSVLIGGGSAVFSVIESTSKTRVDV